MAGQSSNWQEDPVFPACSSGLSSSDAESVGSPFTPRRGVQFALPPQPTIHQQQQLNRLAAELGFSPVSGHHGAQHLAGRYQSPATASAVSSLAGLRGDAPGSRFPAPWNPQNRPQLEALAANSLGTGVMESEWQRQGAWPADQQQHDNGAMLHTMLQYSAGAAAPVQQLRQEQPYSLSGGTQLQVAALSSTVDTMTGHGVCPGGAGTGGASGPSLTQSQVNNPFAGSNASCLPTVAPLPHTNRQPALPEGGVASKFLHTQLIHGQLSQEARAWLPENGNPPMNYDVLPAGLEAAGATPPTPSLSSISAGGVSPTTSSLPLVINQHPLTHAPRLSHAHGEVAVQAHPGHATGAMPPRASSAAAAGNHAGAGSAAFPFLMPVPPAGDVLNVLGTGYLQQDVFLSQGPLAGWDTHQTDHYPDTHQAGHYLDTHQADHYPDALQLQDTGGYGWPAGELELERVVAFDGRSMSSGMSVSGTSAAYAASAASAEDGVPDFLDALQAEPVQGALSDQARSGEDIGYISACSVDAAGREPRVEDPGAEHQAMLRRIAEERTGFPEAITELLDVEFTPKGGLFGCTYNIYLHARGARIPWNDHLRRPGCRLRLVWREKGERKRIEERDGTVCCKCSNDDSALTTVSVHIVQTNSVKELQHILLLQCECGGFLKRLPGVFIWKRRPRNRRPKTRPNAPGDSGGPNNDDDDDNDDNNRKPRKRRQGPEHDNDVYALTKRKVGGSCASNQLTCWVAIGYGQQQCLDSFAASAAIGADTCQHFSMATRLLGGGSRRQLMPAPASSSSLSSEDASTVAYAADLSSESGEDDRSRAISSLYCRSSDRTCYLCGCSNAQLSLYLCLQSVTHASPLPLLDVLEVRSDGRGAGGERCQASSCTLWPSARACPLAGVSSPPTPLEAYLAACKASPIHELVLHWTDPVAVVTVVAGRGGQAAALRLHGRLARLQRRRACTSTQGGDPAAGAAAGAAAAAAAAAAAGEADSSPDADRADLLMLASECAAGGSESGGKLGLCASFEVLPSLLLVQLTFAGASPSSGPLTADTSRLLLAAVLSSNVTVLAGDGDGDGRTDVQQWLAEALSTTEAGAELAKVAPTEAGHLIMLNDDGCECAGVDDGSNGARAADGQVNNLPFNPALDPWFCSAARHQDVDSLLPLGEYGPFRNGGEFHHCLATSLVSAVLLGSTPELAGCGASIPDYADVLDTFSDLTVGALEDRSDCSVGDDKDVGRASDGRDTTDSSDERGNRDDVAALRCEHPVDTTSAKVDGPRQESASDDSDNGDSSDDYSDDCRADSELMRKILAAACQPSMVQGHSDVIRHILGSLGKRRGNAPDDRIIRAVSEELDRGLVASYNFLQEQVSLSNDCDEHLLSACSTFARLKLSPAAWSFCGDAKYEGTAEVVAATTSAAVAGKCANCSLPCLLLENHYGACNCLTDVMPEEAMQQRDSPASSQPLLNMRSTTPQQAAAVAAALQKERSRPGSRAAVAFYEQNRSGGTAEHSSDDDDGVGGDTSDTIVAQLDEMGKESCTDVDHNQVTRTGGRHTYDHAGDQNMSRQLTTPGPDDVTTTTSHRHGRSPVGGAMAMDPDCNECWRSCNVSAKARQGSRPRSATPAAIGQQGWKPGDGLNQETVDSSDSDAIGRDGNMSDGESSDADWNEFTGLPKNLHRVKEQLDDRFTSEAVNKFGGFADTDDGIEIEVCDIRANLVELDNREAVVKIEQHCSFATLAEEAMTLMDGEHTRQAIKLNNLFRGETVDNKPIRKVLAISNAGSGKTAIFMHKVPYEYSSREIWRRLDLLFPFELRNGEVQQAEDWKSLISLHLHHLQPMKISSDDIDATAQFIEGNFSRTGVILDGLDECRLDECSPFMQSLMRSPPEGLFLVVTSRPCKDAAELKLSKAYHRFVEVAGLSKADISEYIKRNLDDGDDAAQLLRQIADNPELEGLMTSPVVTALVCELQKSSACEPPASATDLFHRFVDNKITRFRVGLKGGGQPDADKRAAEAAQKLRRFALHMLFQQSVVFTQDDLERHQLSADAIGVGLLVRGSLVSGGQQYQRRFSHLMVQEFLAAQYAVEMVLSGRTSGPQLVAELGTKNGHLLTFWKFLVALLPTDEANATLMSMLVFSTASEEGSRTHATANWEFLCADNVLDTTSSDLGSRLDDSELLRLVGFLHAGDDGQKEEEVNSDDDSAADAAARIKQALESWTRHESNHTTARLSNTLSTMLPSIASRYNLGAPPPSPTETACMYDLSGDAFVQAWTTDVDGEEHGMKRAMSRDLVVLMNRCFHEHLLRNKAGTSGGRGHHFPSMFYLLRHVGFDLVLKSLALPDARAMSSALQHHPDALRMLDLSLCGIGDRGLQQLLPGLLECRGLREVHLSDNKLAAEHLPSLGRMLENNAATLECFSIARNELRDDGLATLQRGLTACSQLTGLWLNGTGLRSGCSGQRLSSILRHMPRLSTLWLKNNDLGDEGVLALSGVLASMSNLEVINFASTKLSSAVLPALAEVIHSNRKLRLISLDEENHFMDRCPQAEAVFMEAIAQSSFSLLAMPARANLGKAFYKDLCSARKHKRILFKKSVVSQP